MPSYDYACRKCTHTFEHLQRSSRDPSPPCPKCGAVAVEKMLTTVNVGASSGADRAAFAEMPRPSAGPGCGRCGDPQGPCGLG